MGTYTIAVLGGDGIGPEVTAEAVVALRAIERRFGHTFELRTALAGQAAIAREGEAISDETMALCQRSDAVLFGAVGGAGVGDPSAKAQPEHALYRLRKELELFANLRPVRPLPSLVGAATLKREVLRGVDLVVIRELTGGLYYGRPSEIRESPAGASAVDTMVYTESEIERILRFAFTLAHARRKRLTSVDKANVLSCSRLWRRVVERVAPDYPDVEVRQIFVDACAMALIRQPAEFDVIVMENMFGDILTDEASMLTGSLGMLPSASLGTRRTPHGQFGLYEPIHGTAPDITGQGKANPLAAILSAALLLRHSLGLKREANAIERAVRQTIAAGFRTADIARPHSRTISTREMGAEVARRIAAGVSPSSHAAKAPARAGG
jgi:3-isopropylmalate dehydrogenase